MSRLRRGVPLIAVTTLTLLCAACGGAGDTSGTAASCVAPYLDDQPPSGDYGTPAPTLSPGDTITVYGHWYTTTCNDTGGHAALEPLPPVHLTVSLPGDAVEDLGEFDPAGQDMGFSTVIQIPAASAAGAATVRDDVGHTYTFTVGHHP